MEHDDEWWDIYRQIEQIAGALTEESLAEVIAMTAPKPEEA